MCRAPISAILLKKSGVSGDPQLWLPSNITDAQAATMLATFSFRCATSRPVAPGSRYRRPRHAGGPANVCDGNTSRRPQTTIPPSCAGLTCAFRRIVNGPASPRCSAMRKDASDASRGMSSSDLLSSPSWTKVSHFVSVADAVADRRTPMMATKINLANDVHVRCRAGRKTGYPARVTLDFL